MRASTPNQVTGKVEIVITLAQDQDTGVETLALVELVTTWVRAVEVGFFGPGGIRLQGAVEAQGQRVAGRLGCERVSQTAFLALSRMIQHFSKVKGRVESASLFREDGQRLAVEVGAAIPDLPPSIPFAVEYPYDLHADVRVEIEFRAPLTKAQQDAIFDAFSIWDALVQVLGDQEQWGEESEYETRLLSPAIVEHEVFGYYASFECLHFIVLLGLRLNEPLPIERITME